MQLFLIRHGRTPFNEIGRFQGQMAVPLSAGGRAQSERLAQRLAGVVFDAVYASDLDRAAQTAEIVFGQGRYTPDPRLRERGLGIVEGRDRADVAIEHPAFIEAWRTDPSTATCEGIEDHEAMMGRLLAAVAEMHERYPADAKIAWVSHGFAIRALLSAVLELPLGALWRVRIGNTSITELTFDANRRANAQRINDCAHLEESL